MTQVINSSGGCFSLRLLEEISDIYVRGVIISNIVDVGLNLGVRSLTATGLILFYGSQFR